MVLYYDHRINAIRFGVEKLRDALKKVEEYCVERFQREYTGGEDGRLITVSFETQPFPLKASCALAAEGFEIAVDGERIHILGADISGAMYGLLELSEDIALFGFDDIKPKRREPFLRKRGIKFNLPFEPYDMGDPMEKNVQACLDRTFWEQYIDFLAEKRYNLLSLWSEHPFHMMVRVEKYPDACPFDDVTLKRYQELFRFIMDRCKKRGITVYLITWNIRITPFVAKALGLPEYLGDMAKQYDITFDHNNRLPNNSPNEYPIRQHLPVIKDYIKECVKTLLLTYELLGGIGTNCAEEMAGDALTRQQWVMDTYLEAARESGRNIPFIMRTNMGNGKTATVFLDAYPCENNFISWKYSNAHMYSSTSPQFENLWKAWEDVDMSTVKVLFTVRNDDINTFRWGDYGYIRDYVKGMGKEYAEGFYWGADGYLWADDFQTAPHIARSWRYDFEKHWTQFWLLGRLGYNSDEPKERYEALFTAHYGEWGERIQTLLETASRVIPAVNRQFWINYDYEWHPESLLSVYGFKTVIDFVNGVAMPGSGTISLADYAAALTHGEEPRGETPADTIGTLQNAADTLQTGLSALEKDIPAIYKADELGSTLLDLWCWRYLAAYYQCKLSAALELCFYREAGDKAAKEKAVALLETGLSYYRALAACWSRQYLPYKMGRVKYMFGYPLYISDVERDIELAKSV